MPCAQAMPRPQLKICGLRDPAQAAAVALLGADAIGVIGVAGSPRYLPWPQRQAVFAAVQAAAPRCQRVVVVADPSDAALAELGVDGGHGIVQLHGSESPQRCRELAERLDCKIWKALRLRAPEDLEHIDAYAEVVDALLLDAWRPDQLGGTGHPIPIEWLENLAPPLPWWLAGGIRADRVAPVLARLQPFGLDASSGVERSPGDKDLQRVADLVKAMGAAG